MTEAAARGSVLVGIAREAIAERLGLGPAVGREEPWLLVPAASFVTLHCEGDLRGCIGSIDAHRPLGADVAHNARAAAFSDPRFPPVERREFTALDVEVSVLSPRHALAAASESEAVQKLRPGVDGVYLEFGRSHATFLPQVWESIPDPVRFLEALRRKAELPARFWHSELRLTRYTVEKYRDERARA
jgi:hypothetical protein